MLTPEKFIDDFLSHQYDAEARRLYYLRTRQLKGRSAAKAKVTTDKRHAIPQAKPKKTAKQLRELASARHKVLEKKLAVLQNILDKLVAQAKKNAGVKPSGSKATTSKSSGSSKASSKSSEHKKPLTAHQKTVAAKQKKVAYDKLHPHSSLEKQIKEVRLEITKMRAKIREAKAHSKSQATKTKTA